MTRPRMWTLPPPSYGTLRIGYGALREMRAVAHVYARALRQVGYTVELVDTDNSRRHRPARAHGSFS